MPIVCKGKSLENNFLFHPTIITRKAGGLVGWPLSVGDGDPASAGPLFFKQGAVCRKKAGRTGDEMP